MAATDKRARVTAICRALPGTEHTDSGDHSIYRVRWREVAEVVERSFRLAAPKTLLAKLDNA